MNKVKLNQLHGPKIHLQWEICERGNFSLYGENVWNYTRNL